MQIFRELISYKEFLREFTMQQMRSRYRGSLLGFAWTLIVPFVILASLGFVFSYINKADMKSFWPFFLGGFVPWMFFSSAIGASMGSVVANAYFVTRIHAPKAVFPVAAYVMSLIEAVGFAASALVLLALFKHQFTTTLLFLPISAALLLPFVLGTCLLVSAANVFFRDVGFIWASTSMLMFFCTPIFFPLNALPAPVRPFFEANPLYPFVRLFQDPLLGTIPPADITVTAALYAGIVLALGASVFSRSEKSFYLYL
jgi:ABC-2 type transport system permease protein